MIRKPEHRVEDSSIEGLFLIQQTPGDPRSKENSPTRLFPAEARLILFGVLGGDGLRLGVSGQQLANMPRDT